MRARGPFAFASVAALATLLASVIARPVAAQAHAATSDSTTSHVVVLGAAALGAATFNQAAALPPEWRRTWAGYGARVADQVGDGGHVAVFHRHPDRRREAVGQRGHAGGVGRVGV